LSAALSSTEGLQGHAEDRVFSCREKPIREPDQTYAESPAPQIEGKTVSTTFDKVANIIAETSEIDRDTITPDSHTIDDLGIDSLDFLDIVFAIDKEFGIKVPLEKWTQDVNDGKASTDEYFLMKNLCAKIDGLVAAKAAA
jgi:acyl carrier protein